MEEESRNEVQVSVGLFRDLVAHPGCPDLMRLQMEDVEVVQRLKGPKKQMVREAPESQPSADPLRIWSSSWEVPRSCRLEDPLPSGIPQCQKI